MSSAEEVVLCSFCTGKGHKSFTRHLPGHNLTTDEWVETCSKCEGSGRLLKKTSCTFEPYIPEDK